MKRKLIFIWALMLGISILPMSCDLFCRDSCGCKPLPPTKEFSISDFNIKDLIIGSSAFDPETFFPTDQYFKVIEVSEFELLSQNQEPKTSLYFINGAYACSPIPPIAMQSIAELKIINKKTISLADDDVISEDQEVTDRFVISNYPSMNSESITSFLENEQWIFLGEPFYLRWVNSIAKETELQFDIFIKLSDGKEFLFEDEVMKIK
jgi:hypothetical protein